jgi:thiamine biosynthesis lipoprotein
MPTRAPYRPRLIRRMVNTAIHAMPVAERRLRVEQIMGTAISVDVRDQEVAEDAIQRVFGWLRQADQRFSTYKPESEISRLGAGELTLDKCHPDVAIVLSLCEELRVKTGGAFNAWRARRDGRLDPSGVVKGWAVQLAAAMLCDAGARNFAINAGGDVIARGHPQAGRRWRVGIRHPLNANAVATVVEITDMAVATSGNYERGDHILDGRTGEPARGLLSLTTLGPSMIWADAYATAGFAMGESGIAWVAAQPSYSACGITLSGGLRFDQGFASYVDCEDVKSKETGGSEETRSQQTGPRADSHDSRRLRGAQD